MQNATNSLIEASPIEWRLNQDGLAQPYSTIFQDVYYSSDNGLLETDYVFLQGNKLSSRWQQLETQVFTIIETGFGTGLNFLCAAQLWLNHAPKNATLHFISTEKYPLSLQEITSALQLWPALNNFSAQFLAQYSTLINSDKSIRLFDNRVQLTLIIGDATDSLTKTTTPADAWFLDGFSPAKNPDMWQPALFAQMARLSKPNTTFATFTSAGVVKRGLQAAGFHVGKQAGFGKKREMLAGDFIGGSFNEDSVNGKQSTEKPNAD
ncbi:tRNA (5-methylaminomethyl-2-thiouridine)(34)-methyltransferase MnmD [Methylotenera versatilis]|uniref:tRNA (5-methylaminomethyl-2-thiouridine)(34)-methyltransferase MnmD n=1 Tax=Methylotenera versatilis TaxID=1055487 RepID=UPI000646293F|nr:tRNA (5-methylaminomethyl-2-thiouridine)(34)-methyltransferase MnmD [Methylotenera versatilis]